ncbi:MULTISPECIES: hypothetical protein [Rhodobacterales]|uniref:hypothetical protein n=1 Tax=Rhodobacterales TaxID=204455 RepID=UPI0015F0454A|nr:MULTISPECIES: hypothetical protein [Rhodobacterales]
MDGGAILDAFARISLGSYIAAAWATWLSLKAVGQYDAIWHRILGTGVPPHRAARSGTCAIAQVIGFGALSAGVVRRRMLPHLSLAQVTAISTAVPLSFLFCWGGMASSRAGGFALTPGLPDIGLLHWAYPRLSQRLCFYTIALTFCVDLACHGYSG